MISTKLLIKLKMILKENEQLLIIFYYDKLNIKINFIIIEIKL